MYSSCASVVETIFQSKGDTRARSGVAAVGNYKMGVRYTRFGKSISLGWDYQTQTDIYQAGPALGSDFMECGLFATLHPSQQMVYSPTLSMYVLTRLETTLRLIALVTYSHSRLKDFVAF